MDGIRETRNQKPETRNPKPEIRINDENPKSKTTATDHIHSGFWFGIFWPPQAFGFVVSDFGF
jgi:hypothetical protein